MMITNFFWDCAKQLKMLVLVMLLMEMLSMMDLFRVSPAPYWMVS
jgi:hypothetical protein